MPTRRAFLSASSLAALGAAASATVGSRSVAAASLSSPSSTVRIHPRPVTDPDALRVLSQRALDAAVAAGAVYADVRFTVTRTQSYNPRTLPHETESFAIGVRALTKERGGWGFAAYSDWSPELVTSLAQTAVTLGRSAAWPGRDILDIGPPLPVVVGTWTMPVQRDPFTVSWEEKRAFMDAARERARVLPRSVLALDFSFTRQDRTFASTEGAFLTQAVYTALDRGSDFTVGVRGGLRIQAPFCSPHGSGYEIFDEVHALDQIPLIYERLRHGVSGTTIPAVGRFDVVFDGAAMAALVNGTIGEALHADRALGDSLDARSYLSPPARVMNTTVFPSVVTVVADRSTIGGAATVQWDDEGVTPRTVPLVQHGVVQQYATARQYASAFAAASAAPAAVSSTSPPSAGYAAAGSALTPPVVSTPNLTVQPNPNNLSFDDLLTNMGDGFAICGGDIQYNGSFGSGHGASYQTYRVTGGKLTGIVADAAYPFRSRELWKGLVTLGGASSTVTRGFATVNEDGTAIYHSVRAVPAHFRNVAIVNTAV